MQDSDKIRVKDSNLIIIVIICEGKDTETIYLDNFNSKYTKVDVRIADKNSKGKATDPENLVKKAS